MCTWGKRSKKCNYETSTKKEKEKRKARALEWLKKWKHCLISRFSDTVNPSMLHRTDKETSHKESVMSWVVLFDVPFDYVSH